MLIGYAIETLRAEAPLHAASTPAAEAVIASGPGSRDSGGTYHGRIEFTHIVAVPRSEDCPKARSRCGMEGSLIPKRLNGIANEHAPTQRAGVSIWTKDEAQWRRWNFYEAAKNWMLKGQIVTRDLD